MSFVSKILGPRVPAAELARHRVRFLAPSLCFGLAAVLLLVSIFVPYWRLILHAPQYPGGLEVRAYLNHMEGDVREIDGLNHYIGMRPLGEAAALEKSLSIAGVLVLALLILAAIAIHTRWAALAALPALLFPALFLADLGFWLRHFGTNLDPTAPLSSSIDPFVPPVLGRGWVGQFATDALPDQGLILATIASLVILVGLVLHRRAYKPLADAARDGATGADA